MASSQPPPELTDDAKRQVKATDISCSPLYKYVRTKGQVHYFMLPCSPSGRQVTGAKRYNPYLSTPAAIHAERGKVAETKTTSLGSRDLPFGLSQAAAVRRRSGDICDRHLCTPVKNEAPKDIKMPNMHSRALATSPGLLLQTPRIQKPFDRYPKTRTNIRNPNMLKHVDDGQQQQPVPYALPRWAGGSRRCRFERCPRPGAPGAHARAAAERGRRSRPLRRRRPLPRRRRRRRRRRAA